MVFIFFFYFRWQVNRGVTWDLDSVKIEKSCPLGIDAREAVSAEKISCKWVKLNTLNEPQESALEYNKKLAGGVT